MATSESAPYRDLESIRRRARAAAEAVDPEAVVALTRALVRIRSVYEPSSGSNEQEAAQFIAAHLRTMGLAVVLEEAAPGRPNVIADWQGSHYHRSRHRTLMFEGHSDVVTEGDAEAWHHPPFAATLLDGRIYGRGSCDMKAGNAAAICALAAVMQSNPDLPGRIRLGIVADEEGMMLGIKHFIDQGWAEEVDGAIICEPEENELCLFQKGAMRVRVDATGVMAHGAMPYAGVNPIPPLARFISEVSQLQQQEQTRLGEHPYLGLPWFTPTIVQAPARGEAQLNVMPDNASLSLDIRTVPGQDHDSLLQQLQAIASAISAEHSQLSLEVSCFESRPWTETPADDPLVWALEQVYPDILQQAPRYGGVPGATDGTFLHARAGVPIVTVGPGVRTVPHQRDEYVDVADVVAAAQLYAAAAVMYLASSSQVQDD